jgi:hypothetical protein
MAHAFSIIPAKPTFGTLRPNLYQSDYINRKKGLITFCRAPFSPCQRLSIAPSYDIINSFKLGKFSISLDKCNIIPINKSNLIISQYTKENLNNICTVQPLIPYKNPSLCGVENSCLPCQNNNSVIINPSDVFYEKYQIDPLGELFGNTQCGELNYTQYMEFNPSSSKLTLSNL